MQGHLFLCLKKSNGHSALHFRQGCQEPSNCARFIFERNSLVVYENFVVLRKRIKYENYEDTGMAENHVHGGTDDRCMDR